MTNHVLGYIIKWDNVFVCDGATCSHAFTSAKLFKSERAARCRITQIRKIRKMTNPVIVAVYR